MATRSAIYESIQSAQFHLRVVECFCRLTSRKMNNTSRDLCLLLVLQRADTVDSQAAMLSSSLDTHMQKCEACRKTMLPVVTARRARFEIRRLSSTN